MMKSYTVEETGFHNPASIPSQGTPQRWHSSYLVLFALLRALTSHIKSAQRSN
jgi:hypothetical protein